jgi:hypothetical protein
MAFILIGAGLALVGVGAALRARGRRVTCTESHSEDGLNYPWLRGVHGGLHHIEYEEPVGAGVWRRYTRGVWKAHCRVVSHAPAALVQSHMAAFVDPQTRFARLRFHFYDGTVQEPTRDFYELETAWIARYGR